MTSDLNLLRQFAQGNSEDAFREIVRRHLNLVYSAALRQVRSPQLALRKRLRLAIRLLWIRWPACCPPVTKMSETQPFPD